MNFTQYPLNDHYVLTLEGEFDAQFVKEGEEEFKEFVEENSSNIIVDLSNVTFIDSSGIGVLVFYYKRLKSQKRKLVLIGANGQPLKIMKMLRIDETIESYRFLSEYLSSFYQEFRVAG